MSTTTRTPPHHHDIPALKERLLIPEVWQKLGLEGQPGASCRSPFREDKNPSFSISKDGRRWKDYGTGAGGDVIDFIAMARQISTGEALKVFLELAGVPVAVKSRSPQAAASSPGATFKEKATLLPPPPEAWRGLRRRSPPPPSDEETEPLPPLPPLPWLRPRPW